MILIFLVDSENFQVIIKHPVHIVDDDGHLWPTALIPFCEFGGNLSAECRQGSLILGQVFIGTNSNLMVLIGTLIF